MEDRRKINRESTQSISTP